MTERGIKDLASSADYSDQRICVRSFVERAKRYGRREMTKQSDLLEAVSVADRVGELQFTVGQVCRMAGITKMQLDYWTERGSIPTQGKKQRLYDAGSVETVMLIKQARDLGFDVNAAIAASKDFQARQTTLVDRNRTRLAA
jgi:hypothetical protein